MVRVKRFIMTMRVYCKFRKLEVLDIVKLDRIAYCIFGWNSFYSSLCSAKERSLWI